ncbi:hypothetical protein NM688_g6521 [Phlebia brevispora]|uniref:Uncharacterized protein n=1 Tax=Phlebia brevispora TaxID=194682 RepID=A0ACC1SF47_9APHY|nr:hypothetical protein NM688_g6521 [Phlebia brevispora]
MAAICSFGSFGDIVNVIQITYSLAQALRDTGRASNECKDLLEYLDAFGQNLESLRPYVSSGHDSFDGSCAANPQRGAFLRTAHTRAQGEICRHEGTVGAPLQRPS